MQIKPGQLSSIHRALSYLAFLTEAQLLFLPHQNTHLYSGPCSVSWRLSTGAQLRPDRGVWAGGGGGGWAQRGWAEQKAPWQLIHHKEQHLCGCWWTLKGISGAASLQSQAWSHELELLTHILCRLVQERKKKTGKVKDFTRTWITNCNRGNYTCIPLPALRRQNHSFRALLCSVSAHWWGMGAMLALGAASHTRHAVCRYRYV